MKVVSFLALLAVMLGLFFLGRVTGRIFAGEDDVQAGASESKSERAHEGRTVPLDRHGVSMFIARREGYSESAQRLIALYRPAGSGGSGFLEALVALDPDELERLVEELMSHELTPKMRRLAHLVYRRWAEIDPRASLKSLLGPEAQGWKSHFHLMHYALEALARTHPQDALSIVSSIEDETRRGLYFESVFLTLIKRDPAAAARAINEHGIESIPNHAQYQVLVQLMRAWGATDPQAAAAFASGLPPGKGRGSALAFLAAEWGKSNPVAAMRWLKGIEGSAPNVISHAIAKLVENAIEHQPEFALEFINSAESGALTDQTLVKLAKHYSETDAESALAWLKLMDDYDALFSAGQGIIQGLPPGDTDGFKEISRAVPAGARKQLMKGFVYHWASHQPMAAIEWARSLEGREQRAATEGIMDTLMDSESGSHHAEIAELVNSDPNMSRVLSPYVAESWAHQDGAAAFAWANEVERHDVRVKALRDVLASWGRNDATAAREALEMAADLTGEERESLAAQLPAP